MSIQVTRHRIVATTDASGNFTGFTQGAVNGKVEQVSYIPDGATPLDTNSDLDITGEVTGLVVANHDNIGTAAFTRAYRQATHNADGSAALYAAAGTPVNDKVAIAGERLKLVIAQGGNTKSGTFDIIVSD